MFEKTKTSSFQICFISAPHPGNDRRRKHWLKGKKWLTRVDVLEKISNPRASSITQTALISKPQICWFVVSLTNCDHLQI